MDDVTDSDDCNPAGSKPGRRAEVIQARKRALDTPPSAYYNRVPSSPVASGFDDAAGAAPDETYEQPPDEWPWGPHTTRALRHLALAGTKYWRYYDPSDPGTAPLNATVIDFLVEHGVSRTLAEAMASILRADDLKFGPRPR